MNLKNYYEAGRELMVAKLPNGQFAAVAWDPLHGEMYLPVTPILPAGTPAEAQASLDAYAKQNRLSEYYL